MKFLSYFLGTSYCHFTSPINRDQSLHVDKWPVNIENVGRMFQTMEEKPEKVKLDFYGRVPKWLSGSFYRNGPGKLVRIKILFFKNCLFNTI